MPIDWKKFCCPEDKPHSTYSLCEPFIRDGWMVATNSKILIAARTSDEPSSGRKLPRIMDFIDPALKVDAGAWQEWPALALVDGKDVCPDCAGDGTHGSLSCGTCGGKPSHRCTCGCEHFCQSCKQESCRRCDESGEAVFPCLQPVSNRHFYREVDALVRTLPDAQWADDSVDPHDPLRLRFRADDGTFGYGNVMPVGDGGLPNKADH